jgi:membrane-associated phospholipid phosphatase
VRVRLPPFVDAIDERADAALDPIRGNPVADRVFYVASQLGDFSVIWHLVNGALVIAGVRSRKQAVRFALLLGAESLIVNQGVKRVFDRERPQFDGDHPHHVRTPSTSSFPSGHASSATFAAQLLAQEHPRLRWLFRGLAAVVASSRPYVRAHHASDIAAGAVTGAALAAMARPLMR